MPFVNERKFACESCIKGHRSSSCKHTSRPLFEIKKKGRPVSQCKTCRELRQSKKLHSKCICATQDNDLPKPSRKQTGGRYIPITPTLPNGLSDAFPAAEGSSISTTLKRREVSLMNPCECESIWSCTCRSQPTSSTLKAPPSEDNLCTLAHAAAISCGGHPHQTNRRLDLPLCNPVMAAPAKAPKSSTKGDGLRPTTPTNISRKRHKHAGSIHSIYSPVPGPSLAPISVPHNVPNFPIIPPISTMKSLAGSGCTCGLYCACPGCFEHRGPEHASDSRPDCASGSCGDCVDRSTTVESTSIMAQFFARAAAMPAPPQSRHRFWGTDIDPLNVLVYPPNLFQVPEDEECDQRQSADGRHAAFGLVKIPKLECCGGHCSCPEDGCSCGSSCGGRCGDHRTDTTTALSSAAGVEAAPLKSCCSNRVAATTDG